MRPSEVTPVPRRPILDLSPRTEREIRWLVLADTHLGLGLGDPGRGRHAEALAREMAEEITSEAGRRRAGGVLHVGDAKHPIVGTPPPVRPLVFDFFSTLLAAGLRVELVLGNHDVGLVRYLPREVRVHSAAGAVVNGVGFFHGHRWPSNAVLRAPRLVTGHLHPGYRFAAGTSDAPAKERCWVRVAFAPPRPSRRRRRHGPILARELVVLPAFHPLAGIESLNRARPARGRTFLYHRFVGRGLSARAYLLDGTDVGSILMPPRAVGSNRAGEREPPAP